MQKAKKLVVELLFEMKSPHHYCISQEKLPTQESTPRPSAMSAKKGRSILREFNFTPAIDNGAKASEDPPVEIKRETVIEPPISKVSSFPLSLLLRLVVVHSKYIQRFVSSE